MEEPERVPVFHTRLAESLDRRSVINAADQIVAAASLDVALAELARVADVGDLFPRVSRQVRGLRQPVIPRQSRRRGDDPPLSAPV